MRIEILTRMRLRRPCGHVQDVVAGQSIDLPDDQAEKLLMRAPGKARVIEADLFKASDLTGHVVTWDSPLFGLLQGICLEDLVHGVRVVHPLTELECVIPARWLCRATRQLRQAGNETPRLSLTASGEGGYNA